jgi:hypothetical protein
MAISAWDVIPQLCGPRVLWRNHILIVRNEDMNRIEITEESIEITIEGWDKLWSFKGKLTIPRKLISGVYRRPKDMKPPWLRAPGTYLPKVIAAGTYHGSDRKEFWNTHFDDECVVFDLNNFDYTCVVVDVPDAQKLITKLS